MDTKKLRAFVAVAAQGNYRRAGAQIHENYATIRKWVLALEAELGVKLVNIKDKKILLTEQGKDFLSHAKTIMDFSDKELKSFKDNIDALAGTLTIATTHAIANLWLAKSLKSFFMDNPGLKVQIIASDDAVNLIHKEADVALIPRVNTRLDIEQIPIVRYEMGLYASQSYLQYHGAPKTVQELTTHRIISFGDEAAHPYDTINWHLAFLPKNFVPTISVNSGMAIMQLVEEGLGIGAISQAYAKLSKAPLVPILPALCKGPTPSVYLSYPTYRQKSKKIRTLIRYLEGHLT